MLWASTLADQRQPFDPEPDPAGNRVLLMRGDRPPLAVPLGHFEFGEAAQDARGHGAVYMPHHATCPRWKKRPEEG